MDTTNKQQTSWVLVVAIVLILGVVIYFVAYALNKNSTDMNMATTTAEQNAALQQNMDQQNNANLNASTTLGATSTDTGTDTNPDESVSAS